MSPPFVCSQSDLCYEHCSQQYSEEMSKSPALLDIWNICYSAIIRALPAWRGHEGPVWDCPGVPCLPLYNCPCGFKWDHRRCRGGGGTCIRPILVLALISMPTLRQSSANFTGRVFRISLDVNPSFPKMSPLSL